EYLDPFAITGVNPNAGPLAGGQQVRVIGRFPIAAPYNTAAEADTVYRVFFDGIPAAFDDSVSPVITSDSMFVITPPHAAPGLVDVAVATVEATPQLRVLPLGYEYIDESFEIYSVNPDFGFICGGEPVTINGHFPVSTFFSQSLLGNVAGASVYYGVYFGGNFAPFD